VGIAQGGCQALSRSLFSAMVPRQKAAEFLGFFSTSSRFAGIAGPLAFGVIGQFAGESRIAILALAVFIVGGGALLARVDLDEGRRRARAAEAPAETDLR
jgi:UMF1 family MFS transporter